jgi:hypothetical protein
MFGDLIAAGLLLLLTALAYAHNATFPPGVW